jgi:O-antigen/teichoic acid export membrane protein
MTVMGRGGAMPALVRLLRDPTGHALGLMALRSMTIVAKFGVTLFIARYLGLAELGVYGIVTSVMAVGPVVLGFGVANNLAREGARRGVAAITLPLLQYFCFIAPIYLVLWAGSGLIWPERAAWFALIATLLFLDHVQTELFSLMTTNGAAYGANVTYFIRFAGWALLYMPAAFVDQRLRSLDAVLVFWLGGCVLATGVVLLFTRRWGWGAALRALPRSRIQLPHKHGSMGLYLGDVANVSFVYLDRYVVGLFLSPKILGVYVLYWSITNALNNLITVSVVQIQQGALVKVAQGASHRFNAALRAVCLKGAGLALVMGAFATALMYVVVPHLGRPLADDYLPLMFVLAAGLVLRTLYEAVGISFYAYGRDDLILYTVLGVLAVALVLNLSLDPHFGIWAAGGVLVTSYALGLIGRIVVVLRGFRFSAAGAAPPAEIAPAELASAAEARG